MAGRALVTSRQISCRPAATAGVGLVDMQVMVVALQATGPGCWSQRPFFYNPLEAQQWLLRLRA